MIKLNKHGLISKRLIAPEFTVGNTFVEGGGTSEELAVLSLTNEQLAALSYIVNGEGRIIPVGEDGTFDTKIGHSYCIRHTDDLTLHEAWLSNDENLYVKRYGSGQLLFFATSEKCKINDPSYIVTEVFRMAALNDFVDWSGIEQYQKWFKEIEVELTELLGSRDKFVLEIIDENALKVYTDRLDDTQLEAATSLLENVLPQNVDAEVVNRDLRIPLSYNQVEYLQSQRYSGINTNIYPTRNTEVEVDAVIVRVHNWGIVYSANGKYSLAVYSSNDTITLHLYNGGEYVKVPRPEAVALGNRFTAKTNKVGLYVNETLLGNIPESVPFFKSDSQMILSGYSVSGTDGPVAKYYSFSMSEDGELLLDFVPCVDETGAPCMFDVVSKQAFYNFGSGDFLYPTDAAPAAAIRMDDKFYAKLTEHGVRRLYKVPDGCNMSKDEYAAANGFKEIVEPPMPEEGYWAPQWRESDTQVILDWIETEPPTDLET